MARSALAKRAEADLGEIWFIIARDKDDAVDQTIYSLSRWLIYRLLSEVI